MNDEATDVAANDAAQPEAIEAPAESAPTEPPSIREAIEGAFDRVEKSDAASERPRDENGRFMSEDETEPEQAEEEVETEAVEEEPEPEAETTEEPQTAFPDAPERFSEDAKAVWKDAPEPVRAEATRAVREMEAGIEKYKGTGEAFEPYQQFDEMVRANNQDPAEVLKAYTGIEQQLMQDPMQGLETICSQLGTSLRQVAEAVLQRSPDQTAAAQDNIINSLRQEIATLKNEVQGVASSVTQQQEQAMQAEVNNFAKDHPRFEELRGDMGMFMQAGKARNMQEAYEMAERLNPAPQAPAPAVEETAKPTEAQTQKGRKSVTGAPSSGSNPTNRKPSPSAREALKRSFAQAGIT